MRGDAPVGMANLAHAVRQLRLANGLTQDQLGKRIGYSRSQVNNVEHAIDLARPEFLTACDALFGTGELLAGMRKQAQRAGLPSWAVALFEAEANAAAIRAFIPESSPAWSKHHVMRA